MKTLLACILASLLCLSLVGQVVGSYCDSAGKRQIIIDDSLAIASQVQDLISTSIQDGYITCTLDTVYRHRDTLYHDIYYGKQYASLQVSLDSVAAAIVRLTSQRPQAWQELRLEQRAIANTMRSVSRYLGNNGYPFHRLALDDVELDGHHATATLRLDKGPLIRFDSLHIQGDYATISKQYLNRYLAITAGEPYHHDRVLASKQRLRNLPFLRLTGDPTVDFVNGQARVNLPFVGKQASRFDFIVGLVPDDQSSGPQGYTITGEFLGEMVNRFGHGESIYAQIRRLRPEVQEIDLRVDYPYVLGLPLGIDGDFKMFRNSNTFIEVEGKAGLQFIFSGNDRVGIQLTSSTNRLLDIDTMQVLAAKQLPSQLDVSYTAGGVSVDLRHVDYRFSPTRGWNVVASLDLGARRLVVNNTIIQLSTEEVDFALAYDTLSATSFQTDLRIYSDVYLPPNTWSTVKLAADIAYKYNQNQLYTNELYRIGGNKRLRGFEEQSVLTDLYLIGTAEYRLLLDQNSFLSLPIIDYGVYRDQNSATGWETALGVGMGINFATAAGVFNVSFVAGRRDDVPLNLQTAKIHFGYVSLF